MNNLQQIVARRAALIERSTRQRAELETVCSRFQRPAAMFDKGYAMARKVKSHPGIMLGAAALLALVLAKRGALGTLAGAAVKVAKVAVPVVRFWWARRK